MDPEDYMWLGSFDKLEENQKNEERRCDDMIRRTII